MALNVTTAVIGSGCNTATATPSLAQWDQGQVLKIEGVDLPAAYQVEFSTEYTRNAIPRIGNADGVSIPNELLQRSAPITAYIVLHEGESDRETEYWITIHITPRTPPETITPDPEEQSVIDETIAALQAGVAAAEAAAESVQNMGVEAETLPPGSPLTVTKEVDPETGAVTLVFGLTQGPKGDNGYSPTITITEITGGHRFTVTDAIHPSGQSFDVLDGTKGDKGDDGYSPVITITTITGGHRFTVTDKTHPSGQSFDVLDGAKGDQGDDGYSPVVTITTITGGHRVTITDKTHPSGQTFDVLDGVIQSVNGKSAASITLDSGDIEFNDSEDYPDGSVGKEVSDAKNAISKKAPLIINSASGDVASFADGADGMQIHKVVGTIVPQQSGTGTPSPTNIRSISGWTQANIVVSPTSNAEDGVTLPINWQSAAGTIYGGTVTLNEDGSADVVSEWAMKEFDGSDDEGWTGSTNNRQYISVSPKPYYRYSEDSNILCDKLVSRSGQGSTGAWYACFIYGEQTIGVHINNETSAATIKTWLANNPITVLYRMNTPQTFHFDDIGTMLTYYGQNNVWIDTGSITECDYPADTKLYVDGLTAPDEDMIADGLIASGKYFTVNNQLYLSTAQIAAGAQIIPGSNCTATSITEALNALNA